MDELERALRAVLDDPAQLQELRELAMYARLSDNAGYAVQALALRQAELADEISRLADMVARGKRRSNRQEVAA